jgi:hypothetical protein
MKTWIVSVCLWLTIIGLATAASAKEAAKSASVGGGSDTGQDAQPQPGRFQLVVVPTHDGSPFLLDTATGCIWHQVQDKETKRTTFVEVDVGNLHWSWGSGAQSILASRIDGSNLDDKQKRTLKEGLQKTACGLSNVVLTPGPSAPAGQAPVSAPRTP